MTNPAIVAAVEGGDPCGADLTYTQELFMFDRACETIRSLDIETIIDGELASASATSPLDVISMAESLSAKSKNMAVIAPYVEVCWLAEGLPAFAEAMEDLVAVAEAWPGAEDGVYPRADKETGDLEMRAAPLGRLLNAVAGLAQRVGWGGDVPLARRTETDRLLRGVFENWRERLEAAFGSELPSCERAWSSLTPLIGGRAPEEGTGAGADGAATADGTQAVAADAWDTLERASALMAKQDSHSPASPILQLLVSWRPMGIIEIAETMKSSGVSLEQLLDSVKKNMARRT